MATIDVTPAAGAMTAVAAYYLGLFATSHRPRRPPAGGRSPFIIVVVPAHNEALVIESTIAHLLASDYPRKLIMVMNDGSQDETSRIARRVAVSQPVVVVDRPADMAGQGKGAVLNHAYGIIAGAVGMAEGYRGATGSDSALTTPDLPACEAILRAAGLGLEADEIIVCVMDADGQLDRNALEVVSRYFEDPRVGAVQIGVRILNATEGLLERAQDMEFIGFSGFVQTARDRIGSVGLGGNGQFTRLSALESVGRSPWSDCLTEDLDLGLTLVELGWRIRFCPDVFVAQQGLNRVVPLLRQRTRWVHGHYQCWRHYPRLLRAAGVSWLTKLDLCLYLGLLVMVGAYAGNAILGGLQILGFVEVHNNILAAVPSMFGQRLLIEMLSAGPPLCFIWTYQRRASVPFRWWELPAATAYFTLYTYLFAINQVWALLRICLRRRAWAKTSRVRTRSSDESVPVPERATAVA